MKRFDPIRIIAAFALCLLFSRQVFSQEKVAMDDARIVGDESLLRSFLMVCDGDTLKYSLIGESSSGLSYIELLVQDTIINHRECRDKTECSVSGEIVLTALSSQIVTAVVQDNKGLGQMEKMKITPMKDGMRVYYIGSVPGIAGQAPAMLADSGASDAAVSKTASDAGETPAHAPVEPSKDVTLKTAGPVLKIDVTRNEDNDYTLLVSADDSQGIDFIELMENGNFLDVEICEHKKQCVMKKNLKDKSPGRNKYLVKSMNSGGAISFQEQLLYFTD